MTAVILILAFICAALCYALNKETTRAQVLFDSWTTAAARASDLREQNTELVNANMQLHEANTQLYEAMQPRPRLILVKALVHGTAGLELAKHEHRILPQLPGGWGAFELRGNTLPEVTYRVFDEPSMEFVTVRASAAYHEANVTYPGTPESYKVVFVSIITPDQSKPNETHEIAHQEAFEAPYWALLEHLYRYFPLLPVGKEPARVIA